MELIDGENRVRVSALHDFFLGGRDIMEASFMGMRIHFHGVTIMPEQTEWLVACINGRCTYQYRGQSEQERPEASGQAIEAGSGELRAGS